MSQFPEFFLFPQIAFPQIALAIGALTSSLGVGIAEFLGLLLSSSSRVSLVVPDHGCGREVLGRVSLRVSSGMFLVVLDAGMGWEVSRRVWLEEGYGLHTSTGPNFMLFGVYAGIIRVEYG